MSKCANAGRVTKQGAWDVCKSFFFSFFLYYANVYVQDRIQVDDNKKWVNEL